MFAFKKMIAKLGIKASLLAALGVAAASAFAQADSPVGLWKNIDDQTKEAKGLIRITENAGVLSGKIEKVLTKGQEDAKCEACEGALKDKPVAGMQIITGLKKGAEWWEGGTILDPNNGKTYKARLKLIDEGKKLEVRGYIGAPLLGRTQTWIRE
jgi:uncharacterized protein (DUF2147 family)